MLHLDGGGSLAFGWEWRARSAHDEGPKSAMIADEDIVGCLVNGIASLARWATEWAGTAGDATLLAGLYAPDEYPMTLWPYRAMIRDRSQRCDESAPGQPGTETSRPLKKSGGERVPQLRLTKASMPSWLPWSAPSSAASSGGGGDSSARWVVNS